jgi:hypothetical protein
VGGWGGDEVRERSVGLTLTGVQWIGTGSHSHLTSRPDRRHQPIYDCGHPSRCAITRGRGPGAGMLRFIVT